MEIYLPIAEIQVNIILLLLLGFASGMLSGMFGIGGGIIMTPFLIFIGIPSSVAVASVSSQVLATSFSGFLSHFRRRNVDFKMAIVMSVGGYIGSSIGIYIFVFMTKLGYIDLLIVTLYVVVLGTIGVLMGIDSIKAIFRKNLVHINQIHEGRIKTILHRLPLKLNFIRSNLKISLIVPVMISIFAGMLSSIMGIGGGFITVPAMIYILGMPTQVVIGTSLLLIVVVASNITMLQSITMHTIDILLVAIVIVTSVIGAQIGIRVGMKISAEKLKGLLALLILLVVVRFISVFFIEPDYLYMIHKLYK